jgi:hypothetical protein
LCLVDARNRLITSPQASFTNPSQKDIYATREGSLTRLVALALFFAVPASSSARSAATQPMDAAKLRKKLVAQGVGNRVKVTEVDGTIIKGSLASIDADSFQVVPVNAPQPLTILNTQTSNVGKVGMSEGAKLGVGIGVGVIVGIGIVYIVAAAISHH